MNWAKAAIAAAWAVTLVVSISAFRTLRPVVPQRNALAQITAMEGQVQLRHRNLLQWLEVKKGDALAEGAMVATGPRSTAVLQMFDGRQIRMGPLARVAISQRVSGGEEALVQVVQGEAEVVEQSAEAGSWARGASELTSAIRALTSLSLVPEGAPAGREGDSRKAATSRAPVLSLRSADVDTQLGSRIESDGPEFVEVSEASSLAPSVQLGESTADVAPLELPDPIVDETTALQALFDRLSRKELTFIPPRTQRIPLSMEIPVDEALVETLKVPFVRLWAEGEGRGIGEADPWTAQWRENSLVLQIPWEAASLATDSTSMISIRWGATVDLPSGGNRMLRAVKSMVVRMKLPSSLGETPCHLAWTLGSNLGWTRLESEASARGVDVAHCAWGARIVYRHFSNIAVLHVSAPQISGNAFHAVDASGVEVTSSHERFFEFPLEETGLKFVFRGAKSDLWDVRQARGHAGSQEGSWTLPWMRSPTPLPAPVLAENHWLRPFLQRQPLPFLLRVAPEVRRDETLLSLEKLRASLRVWKGDSVAGHPDGKAKVVLLAPRGASSPSESPPSLLGPFALADVNLCWMNLSANGMGDLPAVVANPESAMSVLEAIFGRVLLGTTATSGRRNWFLRGAGGSLRSIKTLGKSWEKSLTAALGYSGAISGVTQEGLEVQFLGQSSPGVWILSTPEVTAGDRWTVGRDSPLVLAYCLQGTDGQGRCEVAAGHSQVSMLAPGHAAKVLP